MERTGQDRKEKKRKERKTSASPATFLSLASAKTEAFISFIYLCKKDLQQTCLFMFIYVYLFVV